MNASAPALPAAEAPVSALDVVTILQSARAAGADEDWERVRQLSESALEQSPDDLEALFQLGLAAFHLGDLALAAKATRMALTENEGVKEFAQALSIYYALAGDISNSLYYGKLAIALSPDERFARLIPPSFPKFDRVFQGISEHPLLARARQAAAEGAWADAEAWYRQHLTFNPDDTDAHLGLASCLLSARQLRGALDTLRVARHVASQDTRVASMLGNVLTMLGEFAEGAACHSWACSLAPDSAVIHAAALQDRLINPDTTPAEAVAESRAWGQRFGASGDDITPPAPPEMKERLTVGYIVGHQGTTTTGAALSAILAKHDPTRFQTVGFGLGALSDGANLTFQKCMDRWHDIAGIDPITLGAMVAAEEIDILVDVCGLAQPDTLSAFGARMAPCQVSWLGAPAGTGLAAMDFVLSDAVVEAGGSEGMVEAPVLLALGTTVAGQLPSDTGNDGARHDRGIVFAADATHADINPRSVGLWAHVLHGVPDSMLLLRDHGYRSGESLDRLTGLFGNFGLAHRVDIVSSADAASFYAQADVALMPIPAARPQAALEAMWSGRPVICLNGPGRLARQAASLVHHLGLGESMVADSPDGYIEHALAWASDPERRNAFAAAARDHLVKADALNPTKRARDLESALRSMWQRVCAAA